MKRIWMLRAAGILCIVAGAYVVVHTSTALVSAGFPSPYPPDDRLAYLFYVIFVCIPSIILGTIAIVGGIYTLRRDIWGLALTGAIAPVVFAGYGFLWMVPITHVGIGIAGILAIIFVVLGKGQFRAKMLARDISPKSRRIAALLAFFLGVFGAHRFYIDRTITAIAMPILNIAGWAVIILVFTRRDMILVSDMFFTAVGIVIMVWMWALVDFIVAVTGDMIDRQGRVIKEW